MLSLGKQVHIERVSYQEKLTHASLSNYRCRHTTGS